MFGRGKETRWPPSGTNPLSWLLSLTWGVVSVPAVTSQKCRFPELHVLGHISWNMEQAGEATTEFFHFRNRSSLAQNSGSDVSNAAPAQTCLTRGLIKAALFIWKLEKPWSRTAALSHTQSDIFPGGGCAASLIQHKPGSQHAGASASREF